jgi:D-alanyl-D-alanine carboxypeptidase (penicillin-binding protein 5/6)
VPLSRRQILRRRRVTVFGGLAVVLATGFYLPLTLLAPLGTASAQVLPYTAPVEPAAEITFPGYGASAIGAIGFPGTLAASGSTEALPIASLSKVITALVVLEAKPLTTDEAGPDISFTAADVALYRSYLAANGKVEPVRSGIVLTQREVLNLTLISSANNYTASLVNWAFGSQDAYVPAVTAWLAANGLTGTTMVEPTGMSPQNVSTAADLVEIGKLALANPLIAQITSTKSEVIPEVGTIENTNDLLAIDGIHGIKTGTLDEAGACLLFAADYVIGTETVTVVGVVLGGKDHPSLDTDIRAMLTGVAAGFHDVQLVTEGQEFARYTTDWDASTTAVAAEGKSVIVWSNTPISLLVQSDPVGLAAAGSDVGILTFAVGSSTVTVPLELSTGVDDPGAGWRLTNPAELF